MCLSRSRVSSPAAGQLDSVAMAYVICDAPRMWRSRTRSTEASPPAAPGSGVDVPLRFRQLGLGSYQLTQGDTWVIVVPMCRGLCRVTVPPERDSRESGSV